MCFKDKLQDSSFELYAIYGIYFIALVLIMIGVFAPPLGIIDNSIIICVGEIIAMSGVLVIVYSLKHNKEITMHHNDTDLHVK